MNQEVFKPIPGYEGIYEASNLGRIKSLKGNSRIFKSKIVNHKGYLITRLFKYGKKKSFKTHQLIAMTFLGHTPCGMKVVVDHIDENKLNNRADNLQLMGNVENILKSQRKKL